MNKMYSSGDYDQSRSSNSVQNVTDSSVLPSPALSSSKPPSPVLSTIAPSMSGLMSPLPLSFTSSAFPSTEFTTRPPSNLSSPDSIPPPVFTTISTNPFIKTPISSPAFSYFESHKVPSSKTNQSNTGYSTRTQSMPKSEATVSATPTSTMVGQPSFLLTADYIVPSNPDISLSANRYPKLSSQPNSDPQLREPSIAFISSKSPIPALSVSVSLNSVPHGPNPQIQEYISEPCFHQFRGSYVSITANRTTSAPAFSVGLFSSPSHSIISAAEHSDSLPKNPTQSVQSMAPNIIATSKSRSPTPVSIKRGVVMDSEISSSSRPDFSSGQACPQVSSKQVCPVVSSEHIHPEETNSGSICTPTNPIISSSSTRTPISPSKSQSLPDFSINWGPAYQSTIQAKPEVKSEKIEEETLHESKNETTPYQMLFPASAILETPLLQIPKSSTIVNVFPNLYSTENLRREFSTEVPYGVSIHSFDSDELVNMRCKPCEIPQSSDKGKKPGLPLWDESLDSIIGTKVITAQKAYFNPNKNAKKESFHFSRINLEEDPPKASSNKQFTEPETPPNIRQVRPGTAGNYEVQKSTKSIRQKKARMMVPIATVSKAPNSAPAATKTVTLLSAMKPSGSIQQCVPDTPTPLQQQEIDRQERRNKWRRIIFWALFGIFMVVCVGMMFVYFAA